MCRYKYQRGFILLATLLLLQIIALLGIVSLTAAATSAKLNARAFNNKAITMEAERALQHVELLLINKQLSCEIAATRSAELAKAPMSWWQANACIGNSSEMRYYYVTEFLGTDDCGIIANTDNNQSVTANYYRITLVAKAHHSPYQIMLQSTIAIASGTTSTCKDRTHFIITGRQHWHQWTKRN